MDMKKILIPVIAIAVIAGGAFAIKKASADSNTSGNSWVQNLASKLGIDESKVSTAVDEVRTEEQQSRLEERISQAVTDGVITDAQKQSVIDKQNEISKKQKELIEEFKTWASDNGIDYDKLQKYLMMGGRGKGDGMFGGPGGKPMDAPDASSSSSSSN